MRRPLLLVGAGAVLALASCGDRDAVHPTGDPCLFLLTFKAKCLPSGESPFCYRPEPQIVRSTAPNCRQKDQ